MKDYFQWVLKKKDNQLDILHKLKKNFLRKKQDESKWKQPLTIMLGNSVVKGSRVTGNS